MWKANVSNDKFCCLCLLFCCCWLLFKSIVVSDVVTSLKQEKSCCPWKWLRILDILCWKWLFASLVSTGYHQWSFWIVFSYLIANREKIGKAKQRELVIHTLVMLPATLSLGSNWNNLFNNLVTAWVSVLQQQEMRTTKIQWKDYKEWFQAWPWIISTGWWSTGIRRGGRLTKVLRNVNVAQGEQWYNKILFTSTYKY